MKILSKIALVTAFLFSAAAAVPAQVVEGELARGIEFYRQGAYDQALAVLEALSKTRNVPDETTVLNYLGLTYLEKAELKKARKTLERAVELAPQNAVLHTNLGFVYLRSNKLRDARGAAEMAIALDEKLFMAYFVRGAAQLWTDKFDEAVADADRTIARQPDFAPAYTLKADALAAQFGKRVGGGGNAKEHVELLSKAVEALEACQKSCPKNADPAAQDEKLESFKVFHDYFSRERTDGVPLIAAADDATAPIKIISKPRAQYTDQARNALVSGKIVLAALFSASGQVTQVLILKPLGYGLDQEAIRAARGIKFTPLMKNGKPVSVVKTIEYSFSIR